MSSYIIFTNDILEILMLLVDDAMTYMSFAMCNKFTASVARKHIKRRQFELMGILPPLFLQSNMDIAKQRAKFETIEKIKKELESIYINHNVGVDVYNFGLFMLVNGYNLGLSPPIEHPGGNLNRHGDIVEITVKNELIITIGGQAMVLTTGCWSFPLINLSYHEVKTKGPCIIQYFYLNTNERRELCHQNYIYQKVGNYIISYHYGMAGIICVNDCVKTKTKKTNKTNKSQIEQLNNLVDLGIIEPYLIWNKKNENT